MEGTAGDILDQVKFFLQLDVLFVLVQPKVETVVLYQIDILFASSPAKGRGLRGDVVRGAFHSDLTADNGLVCVLDFFDVEDALGGETAAAGIACLVESGCHGRTRSFH